MNLYSEKLYGSLEGIDAVVDDDFLFLASSGESCLVESERLAPFIEKIERIVIFGWNRIHPSRCLPGFGFIPLGEKRTI